MATDFSDIDARRAVRRYLAQCQLRVALNFRPNDVAGFGKLEVSVSLHDPEGEELASGADVVSIIEPYGPAA